MKQKFLQKFAKLNCFVFFCVCKQNLLVFFMRREQRLIVSSGTSRYTQHLGIGLKNLIFAIIVQKFTVDV